jgi:hypothetical protein
MICGNVSSQGAAGFVRGSLERGMNMKNLLGAAAALALLAWGVSPANAATVTLGGTNWTLGGTALQIEATPTPTANQPKDTPCIICGGNQPQQPATFGYNDFGNTGNQTDLKFFSSGTFKDHLASDTIGTAYSAGFLINFLLGQADPLLSFSIGVDMNDTSVAQTLESFFFLNLTTKTVLASFSPEPGGVLLPSIHNGTGYADYLITGLSLAGINPGDSLLFYSRITGANDGPDSFFLHANPTVAPVPLPAALPLFGTALGGLFLLHRRRRHSTPD